MSVKQLAFTGISRAKYAAAQTEIYDQAKVALKGDSGEDLVEGVKISWVFNEAAQTLSVTCDGFFSGVAAGKIKALIEGIRA
jgi:hypothetical protein